MPPLVGRADELAVARRLLTAARSSAHGLVIEGAPGIGKTAFLRHTTELAAADGFRVLGCVAAETETQLSLIGLVDLLRDVTADDLEMLPAPQRDAIEVALLRKPGSTERPTDQNLVGVAFVALLRRLAARAPVLVAIDDVQWLDPSSAAVLAFAIRRLDDFAGAVMATVRSPVVDEDPLSLQRGLGPARVRTVRLGGIDADALRRLVELETGRVLPRPQFTATAAASGGNPLLAVTIARAIADHGPAQPAGSLPIPDRLREMVAARIAALSAETRDALLVVAAAPRPTLRLVERIATVASLGEAEEAGLVAVDGQAIGFTHPLYASAIVAAASTSRRRHVHGRLAEIVEDPEEQARHRALAAAGPDHSIAADLDVAGRRAAGRGAWGSAADLLDQAADLTPGETGLLAQRRRLAACDYRIRTGDRARASLVLDTLLADVPTGPLRIDVLRLKADVARSEWSLTEAALLLDEAARLSRCDGSDRELAMVERDRAYIQLHLGDRAAATRHAQRSVDLASRAGDGALEADALAYLALVRFWDGGGVDWSEVDRAVALEPRGNDAPISLRPCGVAAALELWTGNAVTARPKLEALLAESAAAGRDDLSYALSWMAWLDATSGRLECARRFADEAVRMAELAGRPHRVYALAHRAHVEALAGHAVVARAVLRQATDLAGDVGYRGAFPFLAAVAAMLELSDGDPRAAFAAVEHLIPGVEADGVGEPLAAPFVPEAVEAMTALGEFERSEHLLACWEEQGRRLDRPWAIAVAARCRAVLGAARGDEDDVIDEALESALIEHKRLDMPIELGRTMLAKGVVLRRRRQKAAAGESLAEAVALFDECGAVLWAARAREAQSRNGQRTDRSLPGTLTPTERRVAELLAGGHTNKQVAAILFVSPGTVGANVERIYAKLGVRSRAALGAWVHQDGHAPPST